MLVLQFKIGTDGYVMNVSRLQEILPLASLRPVPSAPPSVAGVLDFRGTPVPVIDLPMLMLNRPAARVFSTRMLIVRYRKRGDPVRRLLGVIVEQVSRTLKMDLADFSDPGVSVDDAKYVGKVANLDNGMVQLVEPDELLTEEVHELLFRAETAEVGS